MSKDDDFLDYEEQYFSQENKSFRKQRKILKQKERLNTPQKEQKQDWKKGKVLELTGEGFKVECDNHIIFAVMKGSLKQYKSLDRNLIAIGDFVLLSQVDKPQALIEQILPRTSVLARAENVKKHKQQIIAANIDQVLIITSAIFPRFKPSLVERYVIMAKKGHMKPIVVINKIDLLKKESDLLTIEEIQKAQTLLNAFVNVYKSLKIPILLVSAKTQEGIEDLTQIMKEKTSVFSGQSGVGKTSLINATLHLDLKTSDVATKTQKGKHTTTKAKLMSFARNSYCVDTPGIKSFGLWDISKQELKQYFPEFDPFSMDCKFPNCSHYHEPDCAVKLAVESKEISPIRYESYLSLYEDCT